MKIVIKIIKFLTDKTYRFNVLADRGFFNHWSDEKFLRKKFKLILGYELNLQNPQTFNEKIQWLKLHDRKPNYLSMVDKYEAKKYISSIVGKQYVIPLLGVWGKFEDIDFKQLPHQFVLKTTHDSGGVVICHNKELFDVENARKVLSKSLKSNYYYHGREWPYKHITPRIIAEEYMQDIKTHTLRDYKLMCFNGKVKLSFVCTQRFSKEGLRITFYDREWQPLPFTRKYLSDQLIKAPITYKTMIALAEKLAQNIPFIRVDFYEVNQRVYIGELTLYPGSGLEEFSPNDWDKKIGDLLILPSK